MPAQSAPTAAMINPTTITDSVPRLDTRGDLVGARANHEQVRADVGEHQNIDSRDSARGGAA